MKVFPWFTIERRRGKYGSDKRNDYRGDTKKADQEHFFLVS